MVFAGPAPSNSELEKYNSDYFHQAHGGKSRGVASSAFFTGIAKLRYSYLQNLLHKKGITPLSVLEVGPGEGFFAREWLKKLPSTKYIALESDVSCHPQLKGLGIQIIEKSQSKNIFGAVDLIVMSHVLEHTSSPVEFLNNIASNLQKGGIIFIEVPCKDYLYKPIDEPHLLFFDIKPLKILLEKVGFEVIASTYHGTPVNQRKLIKRVREILIRIRGKLIVSGLCFLFAPHKKEMIGLSAIERAILAPYRAHCEAKNPASWLRMVAVKL
jgi:SAM-dependent methyltransferase